MDAKEQLRASLQDLQSGVAKWCCVMSFTDLLQGHSSCGGVDLFGKNASGSTKTNSVCFSIAATLTTCCRFSISKGLARRHSNCVGLQLCSDRMPRARGKHFFCFFL